MNKLREIPVGSRQEEPEKTREEMIERLIDNMANTIHQEMEEEGSSHTLHNILSEGMRGYNNKQILDSDIEWEYYDTFDVVVKPAKNV